MHTVHLLEQALAAAQALGYGIRQEWLGGEGGACEIRGKKWLFMDLGATPGEQLPVVLEALRGDPRVSQLAVNHELGKLLAIRRSA